VFFRRSLLEGTPPSAVWPWILQIGQDRGGFYSNTWLENLTLADIHNAFLAIGITAAGALAFGRRSWPTDTSLAAAVLLVLLLASEAYAAFGLAFDRRANER
jgi:hypothetical protein